MPENNSARIFGFHNQGTTGNMGTKTELCCTTGKSANDELALAPGVEPNPFIINLQQVVVGDGIGLLYSINTHIGL